MQEEQYYELGIFIDYVHEATSAPIPFGENPGSISEHFMNENVSFRPCVPEYLRKRSIFVIKLLCPFCCVLWCQIHVMMLRHLAVFWRSNATYAKLRDRYW